MRESALIELVRHLPKNSIEDLMRQVAGFVNGMAGGDYARTDLLLPRQAKPCNDASPEIDQAAIGSRDVRVRVEHGGKYRRIQGETSTWHLGVSIQPTYSWRKLACLDIILLMVPTRRSFKHLQDAGGRWFSICTGCFLTVVNTSDMQNETELRPAEVRHVCDVSRLDVERSTAWANLEHYARHLAAQPCIFPRSATHRTTSL